MLLYNHICLLIWTVFSGERCGPWASCSDLKSELLIGFAYILLHKYFWNCFIKVLKIYHSLFQCWGCTKWDKNQAYVLIISVYWLWGTELDAGGIFRGMLLCRVATWGIVCLWKVIIGERERELSLNCYNFQTFKVRL